MAAYKDLVGQKITKVTSNPGEPKTGQMWYNSSDGKLRGLGIVSAWSSGSNTNITRGSGYGFGTLTAGVTGTGEQGPPGLAPAATEEYNGSGWATGNNYPRTDYFISACGTQTAGLASGGFGPPKSNAANHYNGTSWTAAAANMNVAKFSGGMFGVQTSAIYCGGDGPTPPSPGYVATTELYDGSSWSEVADLPVAKRQFATAGTATAGLASGGRIGPGPTVATVDQWDGSSWTAASSLNTARRYLQGWGLQTAALVCGGSPNGSTASALTEMYDGTSWSETGDLATARHFGGTSQNQGDNTSGWMANGNAGPTFYSNTEEWNFSTNTITAGAWSSATNMPEANYGAGSFGTQTAFVYFGGAPYPPKTNATREYNGSSWSTTGNYIGSYMYLAGCGVETAGLGAGGQPPTQTSSAEYDGSSWTSGNSMSNQRQNTGSTMCGTQPAALVVGGDRIPSTPRSLDACEEYDGTNWSTGGTYPTVIQNTAAAGTQTAGWAAGGTIDSSPGTANTFTNATNEYNGSSWTAGGALPIVVCRSGAAGPDTAGLIFSGTPNGPTNITTTFGYDGAAWSTRPNMATARQSVGAGGVSSPSTAAIGAGGYVTPGTTASTEEFNGETSAANITDFTTR